MVNKKKIGSRINSAKTEAAKVAIALDALDTALCNFLNGYGDPYEPRTWWETEVQKSIADLSYAYNLCHEVGAMSWDEKMLSYLFQRRADAKAEYDRIHFEERNSAPKPDTGEG